MEITEEQLKKIFELASLEDKLKSGNEITSVDITQALIRIESKIYSFSSNINGENLENKKVLIADDLELSIYQFNTVLKKIGIVPRIARNKDEAIAELQKIKFDCIIIDLFIPDSSDGFELIDMAVKKRSETDSKMKIVVISGTDDDSLINKCYELGVDLYIQKNKDWHPKLLKYLTTTFQSESNVAYTKYVIDNNAVSYLIKQFNDSKIYDSIIKSVNSSILTGISNIIFDLRDVTAFDSDNAFIFAEIYKISAENGGKFIIVNPSINIKEAITFAYLDNVIIYAKSIEEALSLINN